MVQNLTPHLILNLIFNLATGVAFAQSSGVSTNKIHDQYKCIKATDQTNLDRVNIVTDTENDLVHGFVQHRQGKVAQIDGFLSSHLTLLEILSEIETKSMSDEINPNKIDFFEKIGDQKYGPIKYKETRKGALIQPRGSKKPVDAELLGAVMNAFVQAFTQKHEPLPTTNAEANVDSLKPKQGDRKTITTLQPGAWLGRQGIVSFTAKLDENQKITSIQYRDGQDPMVLINAERELTEEDKEIIAKIKAVLPKFKTFASCCLNDSPRACNQKPTPTASPPPITKEKSQVID